MGGGRTVAGFSANLKLSLLAMLAGMAIVQLAGAEAACTVSPPVEETGGAARPETSAVRVTSKREEKVTHFYVENTEYCEITMTFEMGLVNLKGKMPFPYTAIFPARRVTEAFALEPIDAGAKSSFRYTNYYKLGGQCAQRDDACLYELPYSAGETFKVTQGYNGKFSHRGSNQYAIDWNMPAGTPVHVARAGVVVRVRDDSDKGGSSIEFDRFNNFVLIRHDDGTLGHYCHLKKGGCLVRVGQIVAAGDVIARSGNTGFSSGAHLHFCVFKTLSGRERVSIPIQFRTDVGKVATLAEGHSYRAAEVQGVSAHPANGTASTSAQGGASLE
jgi:murein DD-endopeptidase MepM/ murein hydrolase activator NlpD